MLKEGKRRVARVTQPRKIWAINANGFKTVEGTNFKFGTDAPRESPDMNREKFLRKRGMARVA